MSQQVFKFGNVFFNNNQIIEEYDGKFIEITSNNATIEDGSLFVTDDLGQNFILDIYARKCEITGVGFNQGYLINDLYAEGTEELVDNVWKNDTTNGDKLAQRFTYQIGEESFNYKSFYEVYYSDEDGVPIKELVEFASTTNSAEEIDKFINDNDIEFDEDSDYAYWSDWEIDEDDFYTSFGLNIQL